LSSAVAESVIVESTSVESASAESVSVEAKGASLILYKIKEFAKRLTKYYCHLLFTEQQFKVY